ncbi:uncharacterized protein LOC135689691 [Rhopilema esculentum]|uniref:uncharacterized protein LOC135689691 n=1 Tax=Rhopilema esculentum TaxID=499914 RepID=UPI0031DA8753
MNALYSGITRSHSPLSHSDYPQNGVTISSSLVPLWVSSHLKNVKMKIFVIIITIFMILPSSVKTQTCQIDDYFNVAKQICVPCKQCTAGEHEFRECFGTENRECKDCPENTYFNGKTCRNCSQCVTTEIRPCNASSDALCIVDNAIKKGPNVAVAVTAAIAASAIAIVVIFASVYFYRRKRKQKQPKESPEETPMNENL